MTQDDDTMSVPIFLTAEELQHVNLAMRTYRKVVESFPVSGKILHSLSLIDNVLEEIQEKNEELEIQEITAMNGRIVDGEKQS